MHHPFPPFFHPFLILNYVSTPEAVNPILFPTKLNLAIDYPDYPVYSPANFGLGLFLSVVEAINATPVLRFCQCKFVSLFYTTSSLTSNLFLDELPLANRCFCLPPMFL
jgi:hypothetical protein